MVEHHALSSHLDFLAGGGELGRLMRDHDWSTSPLGPPQTWPHTLRIVVALVLASPQPICLMWGEELAFLYNDAYTPFLGSRHPDAMGRPGRAIRPEVWSDLAPLVERAMAGEATSREDVHHVTERNGRSEHSWWTFACSPMRDERGRVVGLINICSDVTPKILARREATAARDRARGVLENMGEAFVLLNRDLRIVDANAEAMRLEERPRGAILGKTHREAYPDAAPEIEELHRRALAERRPAALEHRRRRPDGRDVWIDMRACPVGEGLAVFHRDVTERKLAETRLRESERRFRLMADAIPQIVWIIDPDGRTEFFNKQWTAYTGVPFEPSTAAEVAAGFVHPEDAARTMAAFEAARASGSVFEVEHRIRSSAGAYRWFLVRAKPHRNPETGEIARWFGASTDIHERKRIEEALAESEARFRNMADHAPAMTWVTDPSGRRTYLNARWYEFTGQTPGAGEGYGWLGAVHPKDRPLAERAFALANAERRNHRVEFRLRRAEGVYRWTIDAAAARFTEGGEYLGHVGSVIDIDERKELETALGRRVAEALAEKRLFAEIIEATDASVQVVDPAFRFLAINETAKRDYERVFGVRPRVGQSVLDALAHLPEEREAARRVWGRALAGETFVETGWWGDDALGRFAFEARFKPLADAEGRRVGAFVFGQDVTERLREQERWATAEAARREADALYRAYFENTAEALFVVNVLEDGGFTVEDLNPAHQASVGLPLADVYRKRIDEILPPELAEKVMSHYRRVLASGEVYEYREMFQLHGEPTHWDTVLVPVRNGEGRIVRLIGASRDLTRQVAAEEALRQSQKMEAVGQLTGGLAHDFNNLLAGVSGSLDLMETRIAQGRLDEVGRYITAAQGAAKRAAALTHRLLAFSRRQTLEPRPTDVNRLVSDMEELIRRTMGPAIEVETVAKTGLWSTLVDPNQLENALLNLCINARDAMPEGGKLTIETDNLRLDARAAGERDLPPGQYVSLCVSDDGVGMRPEVMARAFDPFFTTKPIGQGTGLGLSMIYGFVRQSGGQARLDSEPGRGTTACLHLPRHHAPEEADRPPAVDAAGRGGAEGTILVIDDEPLVRMLVVDVIEELGCVAIEAGDGPEGLKVIRSDVRIDLLITDVGLPNGMNGRQVAEAAREVRPGLQVLFVTGYAEHAVLSHGNLEPGMQVVTKPFDLARLTGRIREMISKG